MPLNISNLGKILKNLNRVSTPIEFNATLPVKIEIKKQLNPITYLIKLGNRETETKSYIPLEVGKKYMAQIKELKHSIRISNLKPLPKMLEILEKTDLPKGFSEFKKDDVIKHIANTKDKNEFLFFANILLAMEKKIYHFSINEEKKALIQFKYSKNKVSFYAIFQNLGEIEGEISENSATIYSPFENVINLIKRFEDEIGLNIKTKLKNTKPLYIFSDKLLDLKA
ncbi:hypothetical protein [Caminibacter sp.]